MWTQDPIVCMLTRLSKGMHVTSVHEALLSIAGTSSGNVVAQASSPKEHWEAVAGRLVGCLWGHILTEMPVKIPDELSLSLCGDTWKTNKPNLWSIVRYTFVKIEPRKSKDWAKMRPNLGWKANNIISKNLLQRNMQLSLCFLFVIEIP